MMLKSLALVSILVLGACSIQIDNRPYVKKTYEGKITHQWASSTSWNPDVYSIGIIMKNGDSKLFEVSCTAGKHENYMEARRLFKLHKVGDKVTVTWYVREAKQDDDSSSKSTS